VAVQTYWPVLAGEPLAAPAMARVLEVHARVLALGSPMLENLPHPVWLGSVQDFWLGRLPPTETGDV